MTDTQWINLALQAGAQGAAMIDGGSIPFHAAFRAACEQNTCGRYHKNWMCPPHVGEIDALIQKARSFSRGMVYQTIGLLEDSFDYEGMQAAAAMHSQIAQRIHAKLPPGVLHLSAGACTLCARCTVEDALPCPYPAQALPSLESHGVAVSELAAACGLKYINGVNTVTYFGAVLFHPGGDNGDA